MNIIHVTPEIYPFSRHSSVAEAVSGLAIKLAADFDNTVYVFSPLYASVDIDKHDIKSNGLKTWVDAGTTVYEYELYELDDDGVKYVFFKNEALFSRIGIYGAGTFDYADNDIRFATFCQAVMNYIKYHSIEVDVLHSHEWATALIPVYKKISFQDIECKTVLTIHSSENLGVFNKFCLDSMNLPWSLYNIDELEYFDSVSFLKGGVVFADYVTTVSPTFAKELLSSEYGLGLDWLFSKHSNKLEGILKGINHDVWCPECRDMVAKKFSASDVSGKKKCRAEVCKKYGLNEDHPIIIHISNLGPSKGIELIIDGLEELSTMDVNFILMGRNVAPTNVCIVTKNKDVYDNVRVLLQDEEYNALEIYSAADIILMPSLYEPRGEQLMIGMRFGAMPVVRRTGGLIDVAEEAVKNGVGFMFDDFKREAMFTALKEAINMFNSNKRDEAIKKIMSIEHNIEKTATHYNKLYNKLMEV